MERRKKEAYEAALKVPGLVKPDQLCVFFVFENNS
jgi:hypothetical protein